MAFGNFIEAVRDRLHRKEKVGNGISYEKVYSAGVEFQNGEPVIDGNGEPVKVKNTYPYYRVRLEPDKYSSEQNPVSLDRPLIMMITGGLDPSQYIIAWKEPYLNLHGKFEKQLTIYDPLFSSGIDGDRAMLSTSQSRHHPHFLDTKALEANFDSSGRNLKITCPSADPDNPIICDVSGNTIYIVKKPSQGVSNKNSMLPKNPVLLPKNPVLREIYRLYRLGRQSPDQYAT